MSTLGRHCRTLIEKRTSRLIECSDFDRAADPVVALHDERVAVRRLRTMLELLTPWLGRRSVKRVDRRLRGVSRGGSRLREWDVHVGRIAARLAAVDDEPERLTLEYLHEWLERRRDRELRRAAKLRGRVDFRATGKALRRLAKKAKRRLGKEPAGRAARAILEPRVDALFSAIPPRDAGEDLERLHRLRIRVKELRYALECVAPELGEPAAGVPARLADLQELLGEHHDRALLEQLLGKRAAKLEERGRVALCGGIGRIVERITAERRALAARSERLCADLDRAVLMTELRSALRAADGARALH